MPKQTALMIVAVMLLLSGLSEATPISTSISLPGTIFQHLSIRTPIDDLFTGVLQQAQSRQAAEQRLDRDFMTGKQRLDAAFGAQKLLICNFPGLGIDQRAQCVNKLNESYQQRLSELRRRTDAERARLACHQF